MNNKKNTPKFFLGANSPFGFFSYFEYLYDPKNWFCYILKGGPGSGKSSLMKKIAAQSAKNGVKTELIYCPSDPNSLDAVIFPEINISIVDGTAPHTVDPTYPGVSDEIINLGEYWDSNLISEKKEDVIRLMNKNTLFRTRATGYLRACRSIKNDIESISSQAVNKEKALQFSKRLSKKLFKKTDELVGKEKIRFISAITPEGIIFFEDTVTALCNQIFVIDDCFGVVSPLIMNYIKSYALSLGHDVITCLCPTNPEKKIECLIFPQTGISFAVSNSNHPLEKLKSIGKKISAKRFLNKKMISSHLRLLNFDKKIERELLNEAISNLHRAKSIHDDIEGIYIPSMHFDRVDNICNQIINQILSN